MRAVVGMLVAVSFAQLCLAEAAELPASTFFDEAKITVNERARADGYMRVRVTPENGAALEATIPVPKRMSENDLARSLAKALEPVIAPLYEVDRDAGEHVKIRKAERSSPRFSVEIAFSAPGFAVILDN